MANNFMNMRAEAKEQIKEMLSEYEGYECDFHNFAFNEDYYECYTDRAEKQLEEMGVFDCIHYAQEYEKDNFGESIVDISDPCALLNFLWYIIGKEELYSMFEDCELWDEWWNDEIKEEQTAQLIKWAEENGKI